MGCDFRFSTIELSIEDYKAMKQKEELLFDTLDYTAKISEKAKGK